MHRKWCLYKNVWWVRSDAQLLIIAHEIKRSFTWFPLFFWIWPIRLFYFHSFHFICFAPFLLFLVVQNVGEKWPDGLLTALKCDQCSSYWWFYSISSQRIRYNLVFSMLTKHASFYLNYYYTCILSVCFLSISIYLFIYVASSTP